MTHSSGYGRPICCEYHDHGDLRRAARRLTHRGTRVGGDGAGPANEGVDDTLVRDSADVSDVRTLAIQSERACDDRHRGDGNVRETSLRENERASDSRSLIM